jgi:hypothetical protein
MNATTPIPPLDRIGIQSISGLTGSFKNSLNLLHSLVLIGSGGRSDLVVLSHSVLTAKGCGTTDTFIDAVKFPA